ncbi:TetR family transcriptional regulator [Streptomyces sp. NPDC102437]|uniref:TetR family transcriptional regulator n=1 Tax=Streptomyces sp. NPDC102437 TaxID=3366175 RepID=UPI00381AB852
MGGNKGARTSSRLAESMLELIQRHGYSGTGLNTVVEHAGAPKGSLYFHFPHALLPLPPGEGGPRREGRRAGGRAIWLSRRRLGARVGHAG